MNVYKPYLEGVDLIGSKSVELAILHLCRYLKTVKSLQDIEDRKAKSLRKTIQQLQDSVPKKTKKTKMDLESELFTFSTMLDDMVTFMKHEADTCEEKVRGMEQHLKGIKSFRDMAENERKKFCVQMDRMKSQLETKLRDLESKRNQYFKKCDDYLLAKGIHDRLDSDINATKRSVTDARENMNMKEKLMSTSREYYKQSISQFNDWQNTTFKEDVKTKTDEMCTVCINLISSYKEESQLFQNKNIEFLMKEYQFNESMLMDLAKMNAQNDMSVVISKFGPDGPLLPEYTYVEHNLLNPNKEVRDSEYNLEKSNSLSRETLSAANSTSSIGTPSIKIEKKSAFTSFKEKFSNIKDRRTSNASTNYIRVCQKEAKSTRKKQTAKGRKNPFEDFVLKDDMSIDELQSILEEMDCYLLIRHKELIGMEKLTNSGVANFTEVEVKECEQMKKSVENYQNIFGDVYNAYTALGGKELVFEWQKIKYMLEFSDPEEEDYDMPSAKEIDQHDRISEGSHDSVQIGDKEYDNLTVFNGQASSYITLYDFTAGNKDELSIKQGDELIFLSEFDENWCSVKMQKDPSKTGLVPVLYIKKK